MTAKNVFGVIVRAIGLLLTVASGGSVLFMLAERFGGGAAEYAITLNGGLLSMGDFRALLAFLAAGVYLLRGAPGVVSFAYPGERLALRRAGAEGRATMPEQPAA